MWPRKVPSPAAVANSVTLARGGGGLKGRLASVGDWCDGNGRSPQMNRFEKQKRGPTW